MPELPDPPDRRRPERLPRPTLRARCDDVAVAVAARAGVTPRTVLGVLLVAALVLLVLGGRLAWVRSQAEPVPVAARERPGTAVAVSATAGSRGAGVSPAVPSPSVPPASSSTAAVGVVVHVVGRVRHPGVLRLPPGSRVLDALAAAGGAASGADLAAVNLARPLVDGEQVVVPRPGERVPAGGGSGAAVGQGRVSAPPAGSSALVDLNTADAAALDALPGIGPVLAGRIVDWRTQNGRFTSVDDLGDVSGIGDALLERLRPLVRV